MTRVYAPRSAHPAGQCPGVKIYPAPFDFVPVIPGCSPPVWITAELAVLENGWQSYADHCLVHDPVEPVTPPLHDARCTASTNPDCRCWYCSTVEGGE